MDGGSSSQTITIVILVIVAIILFIFLLVETVDIPAPLVTPFADGTKIKIRSLANNKYLIPVTCSEIKGISSCDESVTIFCESSMSSKTIIAALGEAGDSNAVWQLCEYLSISISGQAKYLVYLENTQSTNIMAISEGVLVLSSRAAEDCLQAKAENLCFIESERSSTATNVCTRGQLTEFFSFILNENINSTNNTTSGSYFIANACDPTTFLSCDGIGNLDLTKPGCPPIVVFPPPTSQCPNPNATKCTLNFLFEIEPQP